MIQQLKNTPPYISFSYGMEQAAVKQGETATLWLTTLYNQDVYDFALQAAGAAVVKISNYEYRLTYPNKGSYTAQLTVFTKPEPKLPDDTTNPKEEPKDDDGTRPKEDPSGNSAQNVKEDDTPVPEHENDNPGDISNPPAVQPENIVLVSNILEINVM